MTPGLIAALCVGVLVVAVLYSSVGHAGASGYIAVMSLLGLAPVVIKPTALVLNVLVACLATVQFWRAGHFVWRLFWPFGLAAAPFAFLGGYATLPAGAFKAVVGLILLFSALRFLIRPPGDRDITHPSVAVALLSGACLGLLSGLTGTGGGIFLTPLLLFAGWSKAKTAAGVSAPFILLNSISGLAGNVLSTSHVPPVAVPLAAAVLVGGSVGSYLGSARLAHDAMKRLLALVLLVAGVKLLLYG